MNLFTFYPHVYWQCAVLSINASANEDDASAKTTNYGKVAKALGDMQSQGVHIALPDINKAQFGFSPDAESNQIIFGLKAISGVGDEDAAQIIANRPYASIDDFTTKNSNLGASTIIALIKAGCFDSLEQTSRDTIMWRYLLAKAQQDNPPKQKLTMANFKTADALELIPERFAFQRRLIRFRSYVFSKEFMLDKDTYRCDVSAQVFFENTLYKFFKEGIDFDYRGDTLTLFKKPFEKFFKSAIADFATWFTDPNELLPQYNKAVVIRAAQESWGKYCLGTVSAWEMDSLSFYYSGHELANTSASYYGLSKFADIPEEPVIVDTSTRKGVTWDKYALYRIAGTVLDKNKNKHSVTLLTTDGVVTVKFYAEAFAHYDKQISQIELTTGSKTVLEKSWFARGNKLLITGIRRGDTFFPKKYHDSIYQHTVCLITDIYENGLLELQLDRVRA